MPIVPRNSASQVKPASRPDINPPQRTRSVPAASPVVEVAPTSDRRSDVGYKRPPAEHRFKPGQSGNPRGRPKRAKGLKTIVREVMLERTIVRTARGEKKVSRAEALVMKAVELSAKGNMRATEQLFRWFIAAVPDSVDNDSEALNEPLSQSDAATIEMLRAMFAAERDEDPAADNDEEAR